MLRASERRSVLERMLGLLAIPVHPSPLGRANRSTGPILLGPIGAKWALVLDSCGLLPASPCLNESSAVSTRGRIAPERSSGGRPTHDHHMYSYGQENIFN
jgi:hypothetical protein